MKDQTVTLLLRQSGHVCSVWADHEAALEQARVFNADPFVDGEPDPDAPYRVERWAVSNVKDRPSRRWYA